jgi:alanyl-tRNA synthetase
VTGNEIREKFLQFFEGKGHRRVRSSSLVPHGDPTLLFTNAGMNQFKDVFLGLEKREYARATTAQKCVRAGGKHNDLENVGFTRRHHTFFEMLGNFSFGDYFKEKAIPYAWELTTSEDWYGIPKEKLYVTVFIGSGSGPEDYGVIPRDDDAYNLWKAEGVPPGRIHRLGMKENFWQMGDTGPCGPCSEIHYDMGPAASDEDHADCKFPCDCGRYVEIWNLVFMQYNRYCVYERDGYPADWDAKKKAEHKHSNECLQLDLLPKPSVDTGMGLERIAAVVQHKISNYDTDLFVPLMKRAADLCNVDYEKEARSEDGRAGAASLRVISDHARASTFLIADGVVPSNEVRGYVLRKIIRRAIRHGWLLGQKAPFLHQMVFTVRDQMEGAYPELSDGAERIAKTIEAEENRFANVLTQSFPLLEDEIERVSRDVQNLKVQGRLDKVMEGQLATVAELREESKRIWLDTGGAFGNRPRFTASQQVKYLDRGLSSVWVELIPTTVGLTLGLVDSRENRDFQQDDKQPKSFFLGERAFTLSSTHGLPLDFIEAAAKDAGIHFDMEGFEWALAAEKARARASWKGGGKEAARPVYTQIASTFRTEPDFYHGTKAKDCRIEAIVKAGTSVSTIFADEPGEVILDRTAIYAESGGQVADTGAFYDNSESQLLAEVKSAYYPVAGLVAHKVVAKETLRVGDHVSVVADAERRARIIRNHSGTHLVNAALRNILGTHVKQAGSLNAPERLRFDFSHFAHVDAEELRDIEQQVNDEIRLNTAIETNVTSLEEALASGALAFFGDKYPEHNVRVVTIPDPRAARGFYSKELCGGTHVQRVGDIGVLKVVSEESVAAGVRRIEAVTGTGALEHFQNQARILGHLAGQLNVGEDGILAQVEKLSQTAKQLEKELEAQKRKGALSQLDDLAARVQMVKGVKLIAAEVENVDREGLRQLVDSLRQKLGSGVVVLGMPEDGKMALIAGVTKDLTAKVHAGKLIQALAKLVGGSGGGRPDLAEAGGKDTAALKSALLSIPSLLEPLL